MKRWDWDGMFPEAVFPYPVKEEGWRSVMCAIVVGERILGLVLFMSDVTILTFLKYLQKMFPVKF